MVDAFDPLFTVEVPAGSYTIERYPDALTIVQAVPEFQFLSWKDPQGFVDPCDPYGKGRRAIPPTAEAFIDYFRQLPGFTVDSTSELLVDGHRAVRLQLHADVDTPCPDGRLAQWQSKASSVDGNYWFLRPGDTDVLILVELADDVLLMFEVLPAPNDLEDQVIGSIRLLDALPTAP